MGAARVGGLQRGQRVFGVGAKAVEEVLGVEEHLLHPRGQPGDGVADHGQVLGQRGLEGLGHVKVPRLAHDRGHRRARFQDGLHVGVGLGGAAGPPGHAEGGQARVLERHVLHPAEEPEVLGVRSRPAALDVVDAERVQARGDADLVLHGERHALPLSPVTQGRVVDLDVTTHAVPPRRCSSIMRHPSVRTAAASPCRATGRP